MLLSQGRSQPYRFRPSAVFFFSYRSVCIDCYWISRFQVVGTPQIHPSEVIASLLSSGAVEVGYAAHYRRYLAGCSRDRYSVI